MLKMKQLCAGLVVMCSVILAEAVETDRCTETSETVHACAACASALQISMDLCCTSDTVLNFCQNLPQFEGMGELHGNSLPVGSSDEDLGESKRGKYFLGKRDNRYLLGKRDNRYLLGKRPRNNFLGKRGDEEGFIGQQDMLQDMADKRGRNNFLGKRVSQDEPLSQAIKRAKYFLGKKAKYFLGKRSDEMANQVSLNDQAPDDITKRRQKYFLGK